MFTPDQILNLVNAGFTKAEIIAMTSTAQAAAEPVPEAAPAAEPEAVPAAAEEPAAKPEPEAKPAAKPEPEAKPAAEQGPTIADVLAGITKLTSAIQANAIANSVMPQQQRETAEDMIAQIIRPTFKERSVQ